MRRSTGVLSFSLLVGIWSASNGFRAVLRGVNKAHGYKDERGFIKKTLLCLMLLLIFTFSLLVMLGFWIFADALVFVLDPMLQPFFGFFTTAVTWLVLIAATTVMYRLACAQGLPLLKIIPGACVTVLLWALSSEAFSFFVSYYSNIPLIYGSIAGVFTLVVWLNIIAFILLLGNTINALILQKT